MPREFEARSGDISGLEANSKLPKFLPPRLRAARFRLMFFFSSPFGTHCAESGSRSGVREL